MADITMPQLGETVTEGTVTRWLKKIGDPVSQDEVLFEVSTDKVDSEVPSPSGGYLAEILVPEGETVDVGVRLAVVTPEPPGAGAGSAGSQPEAAVRSAPSGAQPDPAPPLPPQPDPSPPLPPQPNPLPPPSPAPPTPAPVPDPVPSMAGAAPGGAVQGYKRSPGNGSVAGSDGKARVLSPVVRRLMTEYGVDAAEVPGSGVDGRITRTDVLSYLEARPRPSTAEVPGRGAATVATPAGPAPATETPAGPIPAAFRASPGVAPAIPPQSVLNGERDEIVPFNNIRRRTAEHMVRSKATSAHTLVAMEVDFENVETVRRRVKDSFRAEEGISLTYLPFVIMAVADGIRAFPHLNASMADDALVIHRDLNLGIAVDLDGEGLIVPVVREADSKRLRALAREVADLASRARRRRLSADEIAGGTFTITNPGPFGTSMTFPIINQPQVAILSTDGIKRRPVVVPAAGGGEAIAIHSVGSLALSFDHRAIDGAYASRFLARTRQVIETWDWSQAL